MADAHYFLSCTCIHSGAEQLPSGDFCPELMPSGDYANGCSNSILQLCATSVQPDICKHAPHGSIYFVKALDGHQPGKPGEPIHATENVCKPGHDGSGAGHDADIRQSCARPMQQYTVYCLGRMSKTFLTAQRKTGQAGIQRSPSFPGLFYWHDTMRKCIHEQSTVHWLQTIEFFR